MLSPLTKRNYRILKYSQVRKGNPLAVDLMLQCAGLVRFPWRMSCSGNKRRESSPWVSRGQKMNVTISAKPSNYAAFITSANNYVNRAGKKWEQGASISSLPPYSSTNRLIYCIVRDLPILDAQTHLIVHRRRLVCPRCGPTLERLSWLAKYSRVTRRLGESVARLCRFSLHIKTHSSPHS